MQLAGRSAFTSGAPTIQTTEGERLVYAQRSGSPDDRPAAIRGEIDRVLRLADHLDPADRALVRSIYDRGMSAGELARAIGRTPRAVNRRLERLVRRVSTPEYRFILRERRSWPATRRRVAELVFLRGGTQRAAAELASIVERLIEQGFDRRRAKRLAAGTDVGQVELAIANADHLEAQQRVRDRRGYLYRAITERWPALAGVAERTKAQRIKAEVEREAEDRRERWRTEDEAIARERAAIESCIASMDDAQLEEAKRTVLAAHPFAARTLADADPRRNVSLRALIYERMGEETKRQRDWEEETKRRRDEETE
jgi:hypothetical protein